MKITKPKVNLKKKKSIKLYTHSYADQEQREREHKFLASRELSTLVPQTLKELLYYNCLLTIQKLI